MKISKNNIYLKIIAIIIIGLLLLIPKEMIEELIEHRNSTQNAAIEEVSSKWGGSQTISGPFITIPYNIYVKEFSQKDSTEKIVAVKQHLHILPTDLKISGNINPEKRERGIYEIVVYNATINISGSFNSINLKEFDIKPEHVQMDKVKFVLGIDDLKGIEEQVNLNWNGQNSPFNSGVPVSDIVSSGINSSIKINTTDNTKYDFSLSLKLKGSQLLYFTPVGKTTNVDISSKWTNPSFNGEFLPDNRQVNDSGFVAHWNVLHLNRNYPQSWVGGRYNINHSSFGIDLLLPVDSYQKSYRSIRYAILFIGFTFLTFFFIEVLKRRFIHPIQYLLVGIALIVFYTLLLSISEHLKYNIAFIISAASTLLLIAGYVKAILKSAQLTMLLTGIIATLYTFIFVIIQLQDYALLIGSIGVFIVLALVMYFSRKIDWYNLNNKETESKKLEEGKIEKS